MERLGRIAAHRLELRADMADVAVDGAIADEARTDIGRRHQVLAREHAARLGGGGVRQGELGGGGGARGTVPRGRDRLQVDHQPAAHHPLLDGDRRSLAAQHRLHPRHQLARAEGLYDIVVGAELEAQDAIHLLVLGGEEDDRHIAAQAQPLAHLGAIELGHEDVQDHQRGRLARRDLQRSKPVVGRQRLVARAPQRKAHDVADVRIVIDDQDLLHDGSLTGAGPVSTAARACAPNLHKPSIHAARAGPSLPPPRLEAAMTDTTAPTPQPRSGQQIRAFLASDNLLARIGMLGFLTLILLIPLGMIGGVIADRSQYEAEATRNVSEAWGGPQTNVGPTIAVPYRRVTPTSETNGTLTLLPDK